MSTKPTISFYGGIGTIGGTKIIIQEDDCRVLFDFGLAYAPGGDFWGGRVQPREGVGRIRDLMALGYIPALDGIYRPEGAHAMNLAAGAGDKTQVFISHLHLDHVAVLDLLADEIPVWMHQDTLRLFRAVAGTGEHPAVPAGARAFEWGVPIQVGPIKVTPLAVDHDIPGASGLLIETSAGTVVYTGDLRMHGARPDVTEAFAQAARATQPKILLIEGTRLGEPAPAPDAPPYPTELDVAPRVALLAGKAKGLALITLYPRNTERNVRIAEKVAEVGRTLVLSPEAAYMYRAMGGDMNQIAVYQRSTDTLGTPEPWKVDLFNSGVRVLDTAAIRANQSRYLLQLFFDNLNELVDLQPEEGSIFIHSNGEPLGKFDPAYELFARWLDHFHLELCYAGSTGHASSAALHQLVQTINPALLMPIHSRQPELLDVAGIRRQLPDLGATYDIATGERIG